MKYRFNRTAISVLGLTALLVGCTPTAQPGTSPVPPVSTTSAPSTPVASTPVAPATAEAGTTPAVSATATAAPEASGTPVASNGANVPVVEGVAITIVKAGSGQPLAKGESASFHYTGWLEGFDSTKKFDSSRERQPIALNIGTGQVIEGWDQGLIGMLPGEIRRLEISPEKAYGAAGRPPAIPPNSTLYFEVEYVPAPAN